jgi:hypothetical protein
MKSVAIIKDFFSPEWLKKAKDFEKVQTYSPQWITNHQFFPPKYVEGPGIILINFIPSPFDLQLQDYMIEQGWLKYRPKHFHALFYRGCSGSYVCWHRDGKEDYTQLERAAMSIYLNEEWGSLWGGWFSWQEDNSEVINSYVPQYNSAVVILKDVEHCTTPIGPSANYPRVSIQLFFEKDALNAEYFNNQL